MKIGRIHAVVLCRASDVGILWWRISIQYIIIVVYALLTYLLTYNPTGSTYLKSVLLDDILKHQLYHTLSYFQNFYIPRNFVEASAYKLQYFTYFITEREVLLTLLLGVYPQLIFVAPGSGIRVSASSHIVLLSTSFVSHQPAFYVCVSSITRVKCRVPLVYFLHPTSTSPSTNNP